MAFVTEHTICHTCGHTNYLHYEKGCRYPKCKCIAYDAPPEIPSKPLGKWQSRLAIAATVLLAIWIYGSFGYALLMMMPPDIRGLFWLLVGEVVIIFVWLRVLALMWSDILSVVRELGRAWRGED